MTSATTVHDGIAVRALARSFGSVHAVRDVTFDALPGRITGLVGPNGAGKTTLFLMLASLLAPDAGEIRIGGADPVSDPAAVRTRIGWMPDTLGAWESLTARETLVVSGRLHDLPKQTAHERADQLIDEVGLTELAAAPARVLSRGQKQLLGLARALVHEPTALLLDEPASGLDPAARVALREHLRRLADAGAAILVSSHVLGELDEMVDDAVFLSEGRTVERAPAASRLREWRIRFAGSREAGQGVWLEQASQALGGVEVRLGRRDLAAMFPDDVAASDGLARLVAAGLRVAEFAPARGDLEAAFLELKEGER